ncbi:MAG TPA: phospho-sugar mutase, partial [Polyangiaceae bacterium]
RMNRAVLIRACHGVAHHLLRDPAARERGVAVGYDARHMSQAFADDAVSVFVAAGFRVLRFAEPGPTPLLAFAVTHLGAAAGVMITASHNPAAYNGLKIYGANGAQIVPPEDADIARAIAAAPPANAVPLAHRDSVGDGDEIGSDVEDAYLRGLSAMVRPPSASLSIVYTPLHGVGQRLAQKAFARAGFDHVVAVAEQVDPNPDFPTTPFPNPEEVGTLDLALAHARERGADLVIAHDPDADRLAIAVPDGGAGHVQLTGNQVGVLLGHYLLTRRSDARPRAAIATIVSSPMLGAIARSLGAHYEETLTGFKWIAARAIALDREGIALALGYEEALGYAVGDLVRDKDGIGAGLIFAELAADCRARGTTVLAYLEQLYRQYGLFASAQRTIALIGGSGASLMKRLRESPLDRIGGRAVLAWRDYAPGYGALPPSDVLACDLEGETRVVVRPSGTEPKLKCYVDHREPLGDHETLADAEDRARREMARIGDDLVAMFRG